MKREKILRGCVIVAFIAMGIYMLNIPQAVHRHKVSADRERIEYMSAPIENPWSPALWDYYCQTHRQDPSVYNRYEEEAFLKWMHTDDYYSALQTLYASKDIPSIEEFNPKNPKK